MLDERTKNVARYTVFAIIDRLLSKAMCVMNLKDIFIQGINAV